MNALIKKMWKKAEKKLSKDKYLGPLIKKYGSCRIKPSKKENYFSNLVEAIVGQQLSGKAAQAIFARLKKGINIDPISIINISESKLREFGLSRAKIKYLKDLSHNVDRGDLEVEKLPYQANEKIIENLTKVKGIGRWTSEMFLIFSLGRADVFPVDDLGIRKGVRRLLGINLEAEKIERLARCWKPYRTVASWYIWKSLDSS